MKNLIAALPIKLLEKFTHHVDTKGFFNCNSTLCYDWCVSKYGLPLTVGAILASGTLDLLSSTDLTWSIASSDSGVLYLFKNQADAIQFKQAWS